MQPETTLIINGAVACVGFIMTMKLIPSFSQLFIAANLYGRDMNKTSDRKVPEALGVVTGAVYLVCMFFFIPIPFMDMTSDGNGSLNFNQK